jgi:hypothetical protein
MCYARDSVPKLDDRRVRRIDEWIAYANSVVEA